MSGVPDGPQEHLPGPGPRSRVIAAARPSLIRKSSMVQVHPGPREPAANRRVLGFSQA